MSHKPTPNETPRKVRKQEERDRKRSEGLVPIEVWIKAEYKHAIRDYAKQLNEYRG